MEFFFLITAKYAKTDMDKAENNCKCYIFTIEKTEMQKKSNAKKTNCIYQLIYVTTRYLPAH